MSQNQYDKAKMVSNFNRAAKTYKKNACIQQTVLDDLLDNLDYVNIQPKKILDLGSGIGSAETLLKKRFPKAQIFQLDVSLQMIRQARRSKWFWQSSSSHYVNADMLALPFKTQTFDLVISSLCFQWEVNHKTVFSEVRRCIKDKGLFLFSTLGPQSMREIKHAWSEVDRFQHSHTFFEIDEYGDQLMLAGFSDPVLVRDLQQQNFKSAIDAVNSIRSIGATNISSERRKTLTPKTKWQAFLSAYNNLRTAVGVPLTYEVFYAVAWAEEKPSGLQETTVPLSTVFKK